LSFLPKFRSMDRIYINIYIYIYVYTHIHTHIYTHSVAGRDLTLILQEELCLSLFRLLLMNSTK